MELVLHRPQSADQQWLESLTLLVDCQKNEAAGI